MNACPYRKDFYQKLGPEDQDKVITQLTEWLVAFEKVVAILVAFYASGQYDKGL